MEVIVLLIFHVQIYTHAVLKVGIFPSFGWGMFGYVTRFVQLRASENI